MQGGKMQRVQDGRARRQVPQRNLFGILFKIDESWSWRDTGTKEIPTLLFESKVHGMLESVQLVLKGPPGAGDYVHWRNPGTHEGQDIKRTFMK